MLLKRLVKPLIPHSLLAFRHRILSSRLDAQFASQPPAEVFGTIYRKRLWGNNGNADFYSGPGSHDVQVVEPYLRTVGAFIQSMERTPDVVDLGCGDFNIGSQLRPLCRRYTACDIVSDLIERNRTAFALHDVDFKVIDAANDPLPVGDVIFVRQVLQHMSNRQIQAVLPKLQQYEWVVITEHVPDSDAFRANIDKQSGPTTRLQFGSGVAVEESPFAMPFVTRLPLCDVKYAPGRVVTVAYLMRTSELFRSNPTL